MHLTPMLLAGTMKQGAAERSCLDCLSQEAEVDGAQKDGTNWLFQSWHKPRLVQNCREQIACSDYPTASLIYPARRINREGVTNRSSETTHSSGDRVVIPRWSVFYSTRRNLMKPDKRRQFLCWNGLQEHHSPAITLTTAVARPISFWIRLPWKRVSTFLGNYYSKIALRVLKLPIYNLLRYENG